MQKEEAIDNYLQAGYRIFPVNGKKPIPKAWPNVKQNPFLDIRSFTKNYGICLQHDDLVIDVDTKDHEDGTPRKGRESFDRLVKLVDLDFKKTFGVRTGSGGFHFYFKKPKDIRVKEKWRAFPDIEFKSKGRFVVGVESIHPETHKPYKIVVGEVCNVQDAPAALLDLITYTPITFEEIQGLKNYSDDEQSVIRCKAYLKTAEAAFEGNGGDQQTYVTACRCRSFGLSPEATYILMDEIYNPRCKPEWDENELKLKVFNAYSYDTAPLGINNPQADFKDIPAQEKKQIDPNAPVFGSKVRKDGTYKAHIQTTLAYFYLTPQLCELLKYNLFTDEVEFTRIPPWYPEGKMLVPFTDNDATFLQCKFAELQKYDLSIPGVYAGILLESHKRPYHPLKDYLGGLVWDEKPRVFTWLHDYAGVEHNPYVEAVGTKTLLGAVARIYDPGCKFDNILVLEGGQDAMKSMLIEALAKDWYADLHLEPHSKDTVACMRNKWIIEVSEMSFVKKAEINAMKSSLSRRIDRHRLSHRRNPEDLPRQSIFIGTINPDEVGYLTDPTGNRRFWPVTVPDDYVCKVKEMERDIDQIWAEAVHLYKNCAEKIYISSDRIKEMARIEAEKRKPIDEWAEMIHSWLNNVKVDGRLRLHVKPMEIWRDCLNGSPRNITKVDSIRITQIMKSLNWKKGSYTYKSEACYGYTRPKTDTSFLVESLLG